MSAPAEPTLTADQQQSLIDHWNNARSLYTHIVNKFRRLNDLHRYNKVMRRKQTTSSTTPITKNTTTNDCSDSDEADDDADADEQDMKSNWNYLLICVHHLLELDNEHVAYHMLATQIYQSFPAYIDASCHQQRITSALESCDTGIQTCLLSLQDHPASFALWITTFYVLKAQILFQQREWRQVIDAILPSLKYQRSENMHLLYNLRASAYCELKLFHDAIADYSLAITKSAEPSSYYNSRGTCWHELAEFDKALLDYNRAIASNDQCVSGYNNRASLYVDIQRYDEALVDANQGLAIYENHGNLYKHRALAHFYRGDYMQCVLDLQKAIRFAPCYRPARVALKMVWDFYYGPVVDALQTLHHGAHVDMCVILVNFMVGDNYHTHSNMVDATYADWKKEMELIEQKKNSKAIQSAET